MNYFIYTSHQYGQCLKILAQITLEDENELAEIREVFPQEINERILRQ